MKTLSGRRVSFLLIAAALLATCGAVPGPAPIHEPPTSTPAEGAEASGGEVIVAVPIPGVVEPERIRLQLDWEGSTVLPFAWGDLPELTLLDDGTLIYRDEQAMAVRLTEAEAQALIQQVLDLGFERLESHTDRCQEVSDGTSACVMDAAISRIRLRLPGGEMREVNNYAEFANDPDALVAIREFLTDYRSPAATPYIPEKAVLYIRTIGNPGSLELLDWPLDPALLARARGEESYCAQVVGQSEAEALVALPRQSMGFQYFREGSQAWEVVLVPWLPGADYAAALASNGLLCPEQRGDRQ